MTYPRTVAGALTELGDLLTELGAPTEPAWLRAAAGVGHTAPADEPAAPSCRSGVGRGWCSARDTFAGDVLRRLGVLNAYDEHPERYPRADLTNYANESRTWWCCPTSRTVHRRRRAGGVPRRTVRAALRAAPHLVRPVPGRGARAARRPAVPAGAGRLTPATARRSARGPAAQRNGSASGPAAQPGGSAVGSAAGGKCAGADGDHQGQQHHGQGQPDRQLAHRRLGENQLQPGKRQ